ncbi:NAD(P)-dependent dehydrogenase, short-chain alcohol dehydrogenase family [Roseovarius nanhaiticus]|uniref:NAD(P)-dependent dehydrogenase, short-chain alcohol dehydrogenase family n=1 Tax=Roseovarius nanhaiticus TaxID=573024 RepID=A0A1N7HGQ3_9RHOB|nr:SDR family oxidoreductase [Roseovarius nanhaiticus]SEK96433.1 NAD(P)-dependent dehydrogenase, short-chain alcohol dehydrogenase family [Roseovarius nanhaiticus]SIS23860.1 NAD(P)-dependent dehydrogenase, short-chain alcohol dehydrogenase family [Roseovarius nanhaiticus]
MELPRTPSMRLDGKRALVTGASRGIGFALAAALAEAGAHVTLAARGAAQLDEAAAALIEASHQADTLALDITDIGAMREAVARFETLDIVVSSAGLARHGPASQTTPEDYDAVMDVNLRAAYFLAQAAAQKMQGRGGAILNVSSQMGHVGGPDRAVYCATKHGLEGMTKAMAIEFGPMGVRINTLCPTFVLTPLTAPTFADPDKRAWIEAKIKLPRVAEVTDLMGPAVFLCSDAAAMITGTHLLVDGGWTAG